VKAEEEYEEITRKLNSRLMHEEMLQAVFGFVIKIFQWNVYS
jgi:hypothetical protein